MIISGSADFGVHLQADQLEQFAAFARLLTEWNQKINLTAITLPADIALKHIVDSLIVLPKIAKDAQVIDMGSGAGFPGIPLKIAYPGFRLLSLDSVRKKIIFQKQVINALKLSRIDAIHTRAEHFAKETGEQFDVVICRALSSLRNIVQYGRPLLRKNGAIFALKGRLKREEIAEAEALADVSLDMERYQLPISGDKRTLVTIRLI